MNIEEHQQRDHRTTIQLDQTALESLTNPWHQEDPRHLDRPGPETRMLEITEQQILSLTHPMEMETTVRTWCMNTRADASDHQGLN